MKLSIISVIVAFLIPISSGYAQSPSSSSSPGQPTCRDLVYGSESYNEKMDQLAKLAHLQDNSWNRYHESLVRGLCNGATKDVEQLINDGFIKSDEAKAVARVLGKTYPAKAARSADGRSYAAVRRRFVEMGACGSCADNIAQHYSKDPGSQCGKLAKRALDGDQAAIKTLIDFPAFCNWKY